jgi:hypothetical protein
MLDPLLPCGQKALPGGHDGGRPTVKNLENRDLGDIEDFAVHALSQIESKKLTRHGCVLR